MRTSTLALAIAAYAAVAAAATAATGDTCSPGLKTAGRTEPRGDIVLAYGSPLTIECALDPEHPRARDYDSSSLRFFRGSDPVDSALVREINATAIRLRVERPPESISFYYCKLETASGFESVCLNQVVVGSPPRPVDDFRCVSNDLDNMTCSWTPHENTIKTQYQLSFRLGGRPGRGIWYTCANVNSSGGVHSCFLSIQTRPLYRSGHPEYLFNLTGTNALGRAQQNITFDHYANVRPAPPLNLTYSERAVDAMTLSWRVSKRLRQFVQRLVYRVSYTSEFDSGEWTTKYETERAQTDRSSPYAYRLTGLRYANAWYDVRVQIRSERAKFDDLWSNHSSVTFLTASKPPDRPPEVDVGGFEAVSNQRHRDVHVYWRQIEPYEENGDNFTYRVAAGPRPTDANRMFAHFDKLSLERVELALVSSNAVGDSFESSRLTIPSQSALLPEPSSFTKTRYDNQTYELSWKRVRSPDVTSYTIFWCDSKRDRPFPCEGRMKWNRIAANVSSVNVTVDVDETYHQFAISANGRNSSSGMVWAMCIILPNKTHDKMKNVWVNRVSDTSIELAWKSECTDSARNVKGYRIGYCPIVAPSVNRTCREPPESRFVEGDVSVERGTIENLKPYTTYAINVTVVTMHGDGIPSNNLYNTTNEGAPTPPSIAGIHDLRNDSVLVVWEPPKLLNGFLKYYIVQYDAEHGTSKSVKVDGTERELRLETLDGYTNYTISVTACTVICSFPSHEVIVRTAIGNPGIIETPMLSSNASRVKITWKPPPVPGGTLDRYEVKVVTELSDSDNVSTVYNSTVPELDVPFLMCLEPNVLSYHYSVRAVNFDRAVNHGAASFANGAHTNVSIRPHSLTEYDAVRYEGSWSEKTISMCSGSQSNMLLRISMYVIIIGLFAIGLVFLLKKGYLQYKKMKNIKPCLPPGLETHIEKEGKSHSKWTNPNKHCKDNDKSIMPSSADAESLLSNKGPNLDLLNRVGICEMSNCSVNTDSTALSLTSSNQVSDETKEPQDINDGNSDSYSGNSSLRTRNAGYSGSRPDSAASTELWNSLQIKMDSKLDVNGMAPYSAIGAWPINEVKADQPLNPLPNSQGYVSFGTLVKPNGNVCSVSFDASKQKLNGGLNNGIESPLLNIGNNTPVVVPEISGYVPNGTENELHLITSPIKNKPVSGYVSVDDPMITLKTHSPLTKNNPSQTNGFSNGEFQMPLISNLPNKSSDCIKQSDIMLTNGIDTCMQKIPQQSNTLNMNLPSENINTIHAALSPEAYCRFGPNTNVPHRFDFQQTDDEIVSDQEMMYFEEPPHSDSRVASHYVPLKH